MAIFRQFEDLVVVVIGFCFFVGLLGVFLVWLKGLWAPEASSHFFFCPSIMILVVPDFKPSSTFHLLWLCMCSSFRSFTGSINRRKTQKFLLNYFFEGGDLGFFLWVFFGGFFFVFLMEQSSNEFIDKGKIPHSSCFNGLLKNSSVSCIFAKSKNLTPQISMNLPYYFMFLPLVIMQMTAWYIWAVNWFRWK